MSVAISSTLVMTPPYPDTPTDVKKAEVPLRQRLRRGLFRLPVSAGRPAASVRRALVHHLRRALLEPRRVRLHDLRHHDPVAGRVLPVSVPLRAPGQAGQTAEDETVLDDTADELEDNIPTPKRSVGCLPERWFRTVMRQVQPVFFTVEICFLSHPASSNSQMHAVFPCLFPNLSQIGLDAAHL